MDKYQELAHGLAAWLISRKLLRVRFDSETKQPFYELRDVLDLTAWPPIYNMDTPEDVANYFIEFGRIKDNDDAPGQGSAGSTPTTSPSL